MERTCLSQIGGTFGTVDDRCVRVSMGGGTIVGTPHKAQGFWDHTMELKSANLRELTAIRMALESFLPIIKNKTVQVLCDNVTSCAHVNFMGGRLKDLDTVARQIWDLVIRNGIQIQAK